MITRPRLIAAMLSMGLVMTCWMIGATAIAQPISWNPPCAYINFVNNTPCPQTISLVTTPAGAIPTVTVPGYNSVGPILVPLGTNIDGIVSAGGTTYPVVQPGPPFPPAPAPSVAWIPSVTLNPGCCADVYFDRARCTVVLFQGTPPCRP